MAEGTSQQNSLDNSVSIQGSLKFKQSLEFDGKFEGDITSEGRFIVGRRADVQAEINASSVIIYGKVTGNITALERCELKANSHLFGDLQTARLIIEEGATFVGKSEVAPGGAPKPKLKEA